MLALLTLLWAAPEVELLRRIPAGQALVLARGESILYEVAGTLREVPESPELEARVATLGRAPGLEILEWTEPVLLRASRRGGGVVTHAIVRADPRAPLGDARLSARVDVTENAGTRNVAILPLEVTVKVVEATASAATIEAAEKSYLDHRARAIASSRLILAMPVFTERLELPPRAALLVGNERIALKAMLSSRLRSEAGWDHLRAAADLADPALVSAAISALARAAEPFPKPSFRPPPLPDPVRVMDQAIGRFDRNELDLAHRDLVRARLTPSLPPDRLPELLVRLGVIEAARGQRELGASLIGQALCLRPSLLPPSQRPPMLKAFEEQKKRGRCNKPLEGLSITATALLADGGKTVALRAMFAPDPFHLIERGTIDLVGPDGARLSRREVAAERGDVAMIEAIFPIEELGPTPEALRVQARAVDGVGLEVATQGFPEPVSVSLAVEQEKPLEIEWWMWAAGGAVVLLGAIAIGAAASSGEPARTIGPIDVRF